MKDDLFMGLSFAVLMASRTEPVHVLMEKDEGPNIRLEIHGSYNRLQLAAVEIMANVINDTMRDKDLSLQLTAANILSFGVTEILKNKVLNDEIIEERRIFHAEADHNDGSAGADHEG